MDGVTRKLTENEIAGLSLITGAMGKVPRCEKSENGRHRYGQNHKCCGACGLRKGTRSPKPKKEFLELTRRIERLSDILKTGGGKTCLMLNAA